MEVDGIISKPSPINYTRGMFSIKPDDESEEDYNEDDWTHRDAAFRSVESAWRGSWMKDFYGVEWNPDLTF